MPESDASPLVRAPRQERSRRTLERILAAGWTLLDEEGPDALTVQGITRRARTSVGSFYARFEGKDDLLRYMADGALESALSDWEALRESLEAIAPSPRDPSIETGADGSAGAPSRAFLERAVEGLGRLYLEGPGRQLALMDGVQDPAPSRRRRLEDRLAVQLGTRMAPGSPRAALAVRVLAGTLHDAAARANARDGGPGSPYPPPRILLSELVELLAGYLGGKVQPASMSVEAVPPASAAATPPSAAATPPSEPTSAPAPTPPAASPAATEGEEALPPPPAAPAAPEEEPSASEPASAESAPAKSEPAESEPKRPAPSEPDPFEVWG